MAMWGIACDGGDGIRHDFTRDAFTRVSDYRETLARAIEVPPATSAPPSGPRPTAASPPRSGPDRASYRAAIRLRVN
jgi:hypothetical protein